MNSINLPVFLQFLESVWLWYPFTFVRVVLEIPTVDQLQLFSFEIGKETCCKSFVNFIISFQIFRNLCWLRSITWLRHFWCHYWICNYSGLDFYLYQNISFYLILDLTDYQFKRLPRERQPVLSSRNILKPILGHSGGISSWLRVKSKETRVLKSSLQSRIRARSNIEMELPEIPNRSMSDSDTDSYF